MIPYVVLPPLDLTSLGLGKLYWFAVFVTVGIILGVLLYDRVCMRGGDIDRKIARILPEAAVIGGFIGAHLVHVLLYHPELMEEDPWVLVKFWAGISSIGGFFGGAIGVMAVLLYRKQKMVPYGDRGLFALTVGWAFGRLGCATAHDHPGLKTDFFLAVAYPGGARHDLGLYEFLYTLILLGFLAWLTRKPWRTGAVMITVLLTYSPLRFVLDFLRATDRDFVDPRYLGLTPAQYGVAIMFAVGLYLVWAQRKYGWAMQSPLWGPDASPLPPRGGAARAPEGEEPVEAPAEAPTEGETDAQAAEPRDDQ